MINASEIAIKTKLSKGRKSQLSTVLKLLVYGSAATTFLILSFLILYISIKGIPYLKPSLFELKYTSENVSLMPSLITTLGLTALSLLIAVPIGVFAAVYLVEYAKRGNKVVEVIGINHRNSIRHTLYCVRTFWDVIFCNLFRLGLFAFSRLLYHSNNDTPPYNKNHRGGLKGSNRWL